MALDRLAERFSRAWRLSGVVTYPNLSPTMQITGQRARTPSMRPGPIFWA